METVKWYFEYHDKMLLKRDYEKGLRGFLVQLPVTALIFQVV
jgi:hypothetical protein